MGSCPGNASSHPAVWGTVDLRPVNKTIALVWRRRLRSLRFTATYVNPAVNSA